MKKNDRNSDFPSTDFVNKFSLSYRECHFLTLDPNSFWNKIIRKTLKLPIFSSHCSTVSYFDLQTFDFFGELDTLRVGQGFTLLRNVSDIQDFAHEVNDRLSWKNGGNKITVKPPDIFTVKSISIILKINIFLKIILEEPAIQGTWSMAMKENKFRKWLMRCQRHKLLDSKYVF